MKNVTFRTEGMSCPSCTDAATKSDEMHSRYTKV